MGRNRAKTQNCWQETIWLRFCSFYLLLHFIELALFIYYFHARGHCRVTEQRWQKPNIGKGPHLRYVVLPTVKCCCHLLDDMIGYRFPHGKGVAAFSSQQHSSLSVFTAFPRNRCCCAEHRLELKLQNASGILTPMFPVYRIIFLCGAYCLAGGQEKLWTHLCVHVQGCLWLLWGTIAGILLNNRKKWFHLCKVLRESYQCHAYLCVICVCGLCLVFFFPRGNPQHKAT